MGWYIIEQAINETNALRRWMEDYCGWTNIEKHVVALEKGTHEGGVYYAAVRSQEGQVGGVVFLVRKDGAREYAVKPMEESVGPYYYDCPISVFDKLDPLPDDAFDNAREWREQVQAFHVMDHSLSDLNDGTQVRMNQPLVMAKNGNLLDRFEVRDFVLHHVGDEPVLFPIFDGEPKESLPIPIDKLSGKPFVVIE